MSGLAVPRAMAPLRTPRPRPKHPMLRAPRPPGRGGLPLLQQAYLCRLHGPGPVGWHCHQCVRRSARQSPVVRYRPGFGAVPRARQAPVTMALIFINVFPVPSRRGFVPADLRQLHHPRLHDAFRPVVPPGRIVLRHQQHPRCGPQHVVPVHHRTSGRTDPGQVAVPRPVHAVRPGRVGGLLPHRQPPTAAAGASGAIFGLFGAYFILARRASANTSSIVALIAINLVFSFTIPDIAWQATWVGW